MSGEQDIRNRQIVPDRRLGVLRVFQQTVPVALVGEADLVCQYTGDHAADGVRHRHRRKLAAGQHKIAERDLLVDAGIDKPLVDALVVAAGQNKMIIVADELARLFLRKPLTLCAHQDGVDMLSARDRLMTAIERIGLHDHALAAAVGGVIHTVVLVGGVVADVDRIDAHQTGGLRASDDALRHHAVDQFGKQRENINCHHRPAVPRWCRMSPVRFPDRPRAGRRGRPGYSGSCRRPE